MQSQHMLLQLLHSHHVHRERILQIILILCARSCSAAFIAFASNSIERMRSDSSLDHTDRSSGGQVFSAARINSDFRVSAVGRKAVFFMHTAAMAGTSGNATDLVPEP